MIEELVVDPIVAEGEELAEDTINGSNATKENYGSWRECSRRRRSKKTKSSVYSIDYMKYILYTNQSYLIRHQNYYSNIII